MAILRARGVETSSWVLKISRHQDAPDRVITVLDTPGPGSEPNLLIDYVGCQILVRGGVGSSEYTFAYDKAEECRRHLLGIPSAPAEMPTLTSITQRGSIVPLGYDDKGRPQFSMNLHLIVEPVFVAGGHRV